MRIKIDSTLGIEKISTYTNLQLNIALSDAEFEIKEEGKQP